MRWRWAPEVADIGNELIRDVAEHEPLGSVRIDWLFMDSVPKSKGRLVLGRARKVSGWPAFLCQGPAESVDYFAPMPFFTVEIAEPTWHQLKPHQKRALVDHELCHCLVDLSDDLPELGMRGHDFEEFTAVIRRHGLWSTASSTVGMAIADELATAVDGIVSFVAGLDSDDKPDDQGDDAGGGL